MNIYTTINNLDNPTLLKYLVIIFAFLFLYKSQNIGLNVILALLLASFVILYLYNKKIEQINLNENEFIQKENYINPEIPMLKHEYNQDLIDFIYSIQDMHIYNPESFEEMADNINHFLKIYDIIFENYSLREQYYQIAESKKNNALNAFHAIILSLPVDNKITDKFNRAHKRLETILNKYLNDLYDECRHKLIIQGYNINKRHINIGPKEANNYFEKDFSYQFY